MTFRTQWLATPAPGHPRPLKREADHPTEAEAEAHAMVLRRTGVTHVVVYEAPPIEETR